MLSGCSIRRLIPNRISIAALRVAIGLAAPAAMPTEASAASLQVPDGFEVTPAALGSLVSFPCSAASMSAAGCLSPKTPA